MSRDPTSFRTFARMGWGGRASSHWRGLVETEKSDFTGRTPINRGQIGTAIYRNPGARVNYEIAGFTRDLDGTILSNCRVELFVSGSDQKIAEVISGADGSFTFGNPGTGPFYMVAYKMGSPDVAGTTVDTIVADLVIPPEAPIGPPAPSTVNYGYAETVSGWGGTLSTTKNAARLYGVANSDVRATFWAGYITGTDAYLNANSDFGTNVLVEVSIDGGLTFTTAANVTTRYTLFTGLSHVARFVVIRFNPGYGEAPYVLNTGTILEVTGTPPSITPIVNWRLPLDANTDKIESNQSQAGVTGFLPALRPSLSNGTIGSNCPSIRFVTDSTSLYIATYSTTVFVSINGAEPTKYTRSEGQGVLVTGLSGTNTYNVWTSTKQVLYVGIGSGTFSNLATKRRMDQYGDSITQGTASGGSVQGDVETFSVAAALGYVGGTSGVGGQVIADLDARLDAVLAAKTVTSSDVAIVAMGRNDIATDGSAFIASYTSVINKLISKGYGKIICRSVLRSQDGTSFTSINTNIATAVSNVGDAKAVYLSIESWNPVTTVDNVHPTTAGYAQMRTFALADYPALLA